jgi:hypothetical protein
MKLSAGTCDKHVQEKEEDAAEDFKGFIVRTAR